MAPAITAPTSPVPPTRCRCYIRRACNHRQAALLQLTLLICVCWWSCISAPLEDMESANSSGGILSTTITVDQYYFENSAISSGFWTRLYNRPGPSGSTLRPGPTLRFRAGDTVTVMLNNSLGPETGSYTDINSFHYANTTNLHTHGLHVSAESPQDNVLLTVSPGGSYTYSYDIPSDHAGGTFWYHAHHHGSTAIQVGGGMLGAIVVEDEDEHIPSAFVAMHEIILIIAQVDIDDLFNRYVAVSGDVLFEHADNYAASAQYTVTLVNGQYQPTATMTQGKWTRLRLVFTSLLDALELEMTSNTIGCEWHLLAKDGIYVSPAPRTLENTVFMGPGNRVDVVVRCSNSGTFVLGSGAGSDVTQTNILTVVVTASFDEIEEDLPTFLPYRPDYLANVYDQTGAEEFDLNFAGARGGAGCTLNGNAWDGSTAVGSMVTGTVQKWTVRAEDKHPFHLHVNSYQLSGVVDSSGFFAQGDWHDVMYRPVGVSVDSYMFSVDSFVTKSVIHCHFLPHEDTGCMGFMQHTGTPGATTGLSGHDMSCTGSSTGTTAYHANCSLNSATTSNPDVDDPGSDDDDDGDSPLASSSGAGNSVVIIVVVAASIVAAVVIGVACFCFTKGSGTKNIQVAVSHGYGGGDIEAAPQKASY